MSAQIAFPWAGESKRERPRYQLSWFDFLSAYARVHGRWQRTMDAEQRTAQGGVTEGRDGEAGSVSEANSTRSAEGGCAPEPRP